LLEFVPPGWWAADQLGGGVDQSAQEILDEPLPELSGVPYVNLAFDESAESSLVS
jgi:hypothetical protein